MRNPNGYGTIIKLSGNRRKPYAIRVTKGWDEDGKQIKKYVGYCSTRKEALEMLATYNSNPIIIENSITFKELYDKWSLIKFETIAPQTVKAYKYAIKYCEPLYDIPMSQIKSDTMNEIIRNLTNLHYAAKKRIKVLFMQIFNYAMENDIVTKNYAEYVILPKDEVAVKPHTVFTSEEIDLLFKQVNKYNMIKPILIMIYSGMRPTELLQLKNKNIFLKENYFRCGIKTDSGKDRIIPINSKIKPYIKEFYNPNEELFISAFMGNKTSYNSFKRDVWDPTIEKLNLKHSPHDCRHTFATLLYQAEANSTSIKKIIGHSDYLITEKVYTHSQIKDLQKAIDLI